MSFDLGVWYSEHPLTNEEAGDLYARLCEEGPILPCENPAVAAFYEELIKCWFG